LLAAGCALNFAFLIVFAHLFQNTPDHELIYGPTLAMRMTLWLPILAAALTLVCTLAIPRLLAAGPFAARFHRLAILAASLGFIPLLIYWNLLGFNY
jgi:hypothetical protein